MGGFLSGVAGGVCCFAGAIAVGLGLGGVSVLETMMDRYQPLFLVASILLMGVWLGRAARGTELAGVGVRGVLRVAGRPALVMRHLVGDAGRCHGCARVARLG